MKLSLRAKLLLPTFLVILLCLSVTGWLSCQSAQKAVQDGLEGQMIITVEGLRSQIDGHLDDLTQNFKTLVERNEILALFVNDTAGASDTGATGNTILRKFLASYPGQFEFLAVAGGDGTVAASSDRSLVDRLQVRNREYFRKSLAGEVATEQVRSRATGEPVLILSVPVVKGGQIVGVFLGSIRLSYFAQHYVSPVRIGRQGYAYLTDNTGQFLVHPETDKILTDSIEGTDWGKRMLTNRNGFQIYDWEGHRKVVAFAAIDRTGWIIAAGANFEDIFAPIAGIRWINLLAALITLVGVGTVLFLVANSVIRAVRQGVGFAEDIMAGDVSRRLALSRQDEIGTLAVALDRMADGLEQKARVAEAIADGDLTVEVALASERDTLGHALRQMTASLNEILSQVQMGGEQIASGATQVAEASQSLSRGATEQASSLEEISASMAEMSSQTAQTAENAGQANTLGKQACEVASNGNAHMQELMAAMDEINSAGQNISKIIKVIDEIAFQTNLLALNAAVEAARAGQHGKGFAVVAEEVRNLAARSAQAARETAEIIEGSVTKGVNGAAIAEKTAEELAKIAGSITKSSDLVAEIAAAANEQAQGIGQINQGLGQVDQVTQQNTANAEESAAAAEELSGQAEQLRRMLTRFKLNKQNLADPPQHKQTAMKALPGIDTVNKKLQRSDTPDNHQGTDDMPVIALNDEEFGKF
jgi:methyl-accepting chemotaxis protein